MGILSYGPFANDDALDWLLRLDHARGIEPVVQALRHATDATNLYLDAHAASVARAAAELAAALHGHPHGTLPETAADWVEMQRAAGRDLTGEGADHEVLVLATRALDLVGTSSELAELWSQREDVDHWEAELDDLRMRLAG